jgi:peptidoglycan/LPS O-acetylase OafA/YrhL
MSLPTTRFRPELEGLRGVAVLLVIAAHAGVAFPGAAIGPDLFFVLSGYLITGLLLRRLDAGRGIELGAFYARRLRRLLPAALVAIAATIGVVALLGDPAATSRAAHDGISALTGTANLRFAITLQDYFAPTEPSVFLPLWSLGVEEQFCLLVPLLVGLAYRAGGRRGVGLLVALIALASTGAALLLTASDPVWAYYLLPTRAYALAIGGLLALGEGQLLRHGRSIAAAGVALLGAILILVPGEEGYPGLVGPLAALASAALIGGSAAGGVIPRLLSLPPLRLVGRISYSLFLLHWPFLVVPVMFGVAMTPALTLLAVAGSFAAATLLYIGVERPFREGWIIGEEPRRVLPRVGVLAGSGILALALIGLPPAPVVADDPVVPPSPIVLAPTTPPTELPVARRWSGVIRIDGTSAHYLTGPLPTDLRPSIERAARDADDVIPSGCGYTDAGTKAKSCVYGVAGGPRIAIVGTSHAAHWVPALEAIARETGWEINPYVKTNCPFVDYEVDSARLGRRFTECTAWRERVIAELNANPPLLVIIASARHHDPSGRVDTLGEAADAVVAMTDRLTAPVAIFADAPYGQADLPSCLARNRDDVAPCAIAKSGSTYGWATKRDLLIAERSELPVFDFTPSLCPASRCAPIVDGIVVYHDHHHLTTTMARHLAPALAAELVPFVASLLPPPPPPSSAPPQRGGGGV